MRHSASCLLSIILLCAPGLGMRTAYATSNIVWLGKFSEQGLRDWQPKFFTGQTNYQVESSAQYKQFIVATAKASASGYFKHQRFATTRTPYLNWRWMVRKPLSSASENTKATDDFAARIYVIVSGGALFWRTIALNYVWCQHNQALSHWPNPYTRQAMMFCVRDQRDSPQTWYSEKRHLVQDFKTLFKRDIDHIDAIAIMTDADNTKLEAGGAYGDIFLSEE